MGVFPPVAKHVPPFGGSSSGESLAGMRMKMGCFMDDLY